jgi:predicted membrane-bound mannosyltransferase
VKPRLFFWLLVVTLLIAAGLRLWQIGSLPLGLHYDEAADTIIAQQIARGESAPIFVAAYTGKEVLFFYWAALWMKLIGPSVFAMRLAAAMLGVLTVAVTYWTVL